VDYIKKKRLKTQKIDYLEETITDKGKLVEELELEKEKVEEINRAVGCLEIKYKEVIWLYYFEDKNYEEISDILRVPASQVGVWLFRGKERLRKMLTKEK
jgi:RNA polymerase sigma-70 factor (ECF subfamily)